MSPHPVCEGQEHNNEMSVHPLCGDPITGIPFLHLHNITRWDITCFKMAYALNGAQ